MSKSKKGFIPVMLTPFNKDGSIDYKTLTDLTEMYLKSGVAGLFANCLSSEMFELTPAERLKVTQHVVNIVDGHVPVVATGTFEGSITQQADFTKLIYDTGIKAVIFITGLLAKHDNSDTIFRDNVLNLLHLTPGIATGFYECPVPYKRLITADLLQQFVNTGRVIYHKDTCLDIDLIKQKLSGVSNNPEFGLYDAYMVHAIDSLKAGSAGLSCIQGNFFPELIIWICKNYNDPSKSTELDLVQKFLTTNMDVMHDIYPITAKYILQKNGLGISTFTRRDVGNFSSTVKSNIEQLYTDYKVLKAKVQI